METNFLRRSRQLGDERLVAASTVFLHFLLRSRRRRELGTEKAYRRYVVGDHYFGSCRGFNRSALRGQSAYLFSGGGDRGVTRLTDVSVRP